MLKIVLCILIIISGAGAGQLKAKTFENRVMHLQDFITTLKILESEMKYRLDPLPVVFMRIRKMKNGLASKLMEKTSQLMEEGFSHEFSKCWNQAAISVYRETSFTKTDMQIICDFGIDLGKTDMEGQFNLFSRAYSLLESQVTDAIEEKKTKGKMYKSLGVSIGILVVILLV